MPDGVGFFYGAVPGDSRQINVRDEPVNDKVSLWRAYVGGDPIGHFSTKEFAEQQAIAWIKSHPEKL